jgi:hypothetical protein
MAESSDPSLSTQRPLPSRTNYSNLSRPFPKNVTYSELLCYNRISRIHIEPGGDPLCPLHHILRRLWPHGPSFRANRREGPLFPKKSTTSQPSKQTSAPRPLAAASRLLRPAASTPSPGPGPLDHITLPKEEGPLFLRKNTTSQPSKQTSALRPLAAACRLLRRRSLRRCRFHPDPRPRPAGSPAILKRGRTFVSKKRHHIAAFETNIRPPAACRRLRRRSLRRCFLRSAAPCGAAASTLIPDPGPLDHLPCSKEKRPLFPKKSTTSQPSKQTSALRPLAAACAAAPCGAASCAPPLLAALPLPP